MQQGAFGIANAQTLLKAARASRFSPIVFRTWVVRVHLSHRIYLSSLLSQVGRTPPPPGPLRASTWASCIMC
jgi:hypothetical protein